MHSARRHADSLCTVCWQLALKQNSDACCLLLTHDVGWHVKTRALGVSRQDIEHWRCAPQGRADKVAALLVRITTCGQADAVLRINRAVRAAGRQSRGGARWEGTPRGTMR